MNKENENPQLSAAEKMYQSHFEECGEISTKKQGKSERETKEIFRENA